MGEDNSKKTGFIQKVCSEVCPDRKTVLIVDDERGIRKKVARDILSFDSDIVVYEAGNGKEALDTLTEIRSKYSNDPVLIVLDLNMPVMDGWEFMARLKDQYERMGRSEGIPIVVLSSTSGEKEGNTIHDRKTGYVPLVAVAKEICNDKSLYNTTEEKGLAGWLEYLVSRR